MKSDAKLISVVAPCYYDAENVEELCRRILKVADDLRISFEIIIVDDGSPDDSWSVIKSISRNYNNVLGLRLSRNFGQHIAITAGIERSQGDYVIIMDGDLQDLPEEIPKLYKKILEGYDLVFSTRKNRMDNKFRLVFSLIYRYFINQMSGLEIPYNISMMRIFTREFAMQYLKFNEKRRTLGAIFVWMGFKKAHIEVEHGKRYSGKSNYSAFKLLKRAINDITSFSTLPIAIIGFIGLIISAISFIFALWIVVRFWLLGLTSQPGWPSIICAISFSTGVIMLSLSVIGKYISNIFYEVLDRPLYLIAEETGSKVNNK